MKIRYITLAIVSILLIWKIAAWQKNTHEWYDSPTGKYTKEAAVERYMEVSVLKSGYTTDSIPSDLYFSTSGFNYIEHKYYDVDITILDTIFDNIGNIRILDYYTADSMIMCRGIWGYEPVTVRKRRRIEK